MPPVQPPSGHVFRLDRARGPVWYAKYRLPDGRQVQRKIGPAWTERGRPPAGYVTKRLAEAWLRDVLDQARRGSLPGMVRTGRDIRRCGRGVPALRRRRARLQAVDAARLSLDRRGAPGPAVRRRAHRGHHAGDDRGVARIVRPASGGAHEEQVARRPARHLPARADRLEAADQPGGRHREAPPALERRHRRVLAGGGPGARSRGRRRAGRGDLPDRGVHGASPRRAARAALARRRLRGSGDQGARQLRGRSGHVAEVRQGALGADGARRRDRAGRPWPARALDRRRRPGLRRHRRRPCRRLGAAAPLRRRRCSAPACGRCASTTCATRSGRG